MARKGYKLAEFTMLVSVEMLDTIENDPQFKELVEQFVVKQMRHHAIVQDYNHLLMIDKPSDLVDYREVTWKAFYFGET